MVGILNTAFGYTLFVLLIWLGLYYPYAVGLGTVLGVLFNFQTTGRLVFGNAKWQSIFRFIGVYFLIYLLNVGGVAILLELGCTAYLAGAILLIPMAGISYLMLHFFVY